MIDVPEGCRLIILDLDGTLALMPIDWTGMKVALAKRFPGASFAQLSAGVRDVERRHGSAGRGACFDVIRRFERASLEGTRPVQDVCELVHAYRGRAQFAICSNNLHATVEDVVGALDLRSDFALLIGRDDVRECKPSPEGLLKILETLRVRAADAVFIGNHGTDAEAGARAGIRTIVLST